jgi:proline iminopeptidase
MRRAIASIVGIGAAYAVVVRPRMLRWGATDAEIAREYPGRELIPDGYRGATMATTIDAPRERVWPWLLQMGYGRAGWYSWDHLDNWGHASAKELHPEWQDVSLGDKLPSMPDNRTWWEVAALEPERFLGLRASVSLGGKPFDPRGPRPRYFTDSLWGFLLEDAPGGKTRLVVSGYWALSPRWLLPIASVLLLEPSHWIMQMRQFGNLRRLVEHRPYTPVSTRQT